MLSDQTSSDLRTSVLPTNGENQLWNSAFLDSGSSFCVHTGSQSRSVAHSHPDPSPVLLQGGLDSSRSDFRNSDFRCSEYTRQMDQAHRSMGSEQILASRNNFSVQETFFSTVTTIHDRSFRHHRKNNHLLSLCPINLGSDCPNLGSDCRSDRSDEGRRANRLSVCQVDEACECEATGLKVGTKGILAARRHSRPFATPQKTPQKRLPLRRNSTSSAKLSNTGGHELPRQLQRRISAPQAFDEYLVSSVPHSRYNLRHENYDNACSRKLPPFYGEDDYHLKPSASLPCCVRTSRQTLLNKMSASCDRYGREQATKISRIDEEGPHHSYDHVGSCSGATSGSRQTTLSLRGFAQSLRADIYGDMSRRNSDVHGGSNDVLGGRNHDHSTSIDANSSIRNQMFGGIVPEPNRSSSVTQDVNGKIVDSTKELTSTKEPNVNWYNAIAGTEDVGNPKDAGSSFLIAEQREVRGNETLQNATEDKINASHAKVATANQTVTQIEGSDGSGSPTPVHHGIKSASYDYSSRSIEHGTLTSENVASRMNHIQNLESEEADIQLYEDHSSILGSCEKNADDIEYGLITTTVEKFRVSPLQPLMRNPPVIGSELKNLCSPPDPPRQQRIWSAEDAEESESCCSYDSRATGSSCSGTSSGTEDLLKQVRLIDPEDIDFSGVDVLGHGAGGVVQKAIHRPTATPLAVKIMKVAQERDVYQQTVNDLNIFIDMSHAESPFLVKMYAAYMTKDLSNIHIVLEHMDLGSLADVFRNTDVVFREDMLAFLVMQMLEALKTLHLNDIVHRDVKMENILINSDGEIKLTDFGVSRKLAPDEIDCETFVGTRALMAPERFGRCISGGYGKPSDIWSLGIVVYELASGSLPKSKMPGSVEDAVMAVQSPPRLRNPTDAGDFTCSERKRKKSRRHHDIAKDEKLSLGATPLIIRATPGNEAGIDVVSEHDHSALLESTFSANLGSSPDAIGPMDALASTDSLVPQNPASQIHFMTEGDASATNSSIPTGNTTIPITNTTIPIGSTLIPTTNTITRSGSTSIPISNSTISHDNALGTASFAATEKAKLDSSMDIPSSCSTMAPNSCVESRRSTSICIDTSLLEGSDGLNDPPPITPICSQPLNSSGLMSTTLKRVPEESGGSRRKSPRKRRLSSTVGNSSRKKPLTSSGLMNSSTVGASSRKKTRKVKRLYSEELMNFIECCLQKDPKFRYTAIDLQTHPFLEKALQVKQEQVAEFLHSVVSTKKSRGRM